MTTTLSALVAVFELRCAERTSVGQCLDGRTHFASCGHLFVLVVWIGHL
jgi:hypothetical protein